MWSKFWKYDYFKREIELIEIISVYSDGKVKSQVERVFNIWVERNVYESDFVGKLRQKLTGKK